MSLVFVLVEPTRAANVGAAARAIKTMGFEQLILVNSSLHLEKEAHWVAHGATDILERTLVVDSVADIRAQYDQLIATTARERGTPRQYLTPDELKGTLIEQSDSVKKIALLFGRESSGLSNSELELCDVFSYVPLINDYPSLNLAQAVMVYSYALSEVNNRLKQKQIQPQEGQLQALKNRTQLLLQELGTQDDVKLSRWLLDGMSLLGDRDCKMAHQLLNDIGRKLNTDK
ncbi:tRNA/rRNA methyltransferase [Shewanella violacea]|uniref:tRNA (cytidine/uridine-2'-O-)-methyltransferase TrmJ n=1 Tax=Shewanella violacea (strain JCM 10179 / CIP 106290 / LMG 19151 / DSS12) TaxID=637905 RepID=D4ZKC3_SHEVD|nr:tRNA/rRNA methyltransferase [Shewanella violacea]BAJ02122.1 RNA methyltransferase, TrmH family, group 1 [Shewanella violacea DSS12]